MDKDTYYQNIVDSALFIKESVNKNIPKVAIMMGTGLSSIVDDMTESISIDYSDIQNFPKSTVQSHKGKLVIGKLEGTEVLVLAGRWHYYEGYSSKLVIIKDHINTIPDHPLRGENDDRLGPRFPDMLTTYDSGLRQKIAQSAADLEIQIHEGIYYGLQGPSLETPAEYVMIHNLGADMVGMSTVPEVIVAKHAGLLIGAVSIISNVCYPPERITETTVEEVIKVANGASDKLNQILGKLISDISM